MRRALTALRDPRVRTTLTVCVVAALCFSVGEGLRLLPLPDGPTARADFRPGASDRVNAPQNQFKPGSLCMPPQAQKDPHYKRTHYASASGCTLPLPHHVPLHTGAQRRAGRDLTGTTHSPAGRAPPHTT